jgi:hypothetical protein
MRSPSAQKGLLLELVPFHVRIVSLAAEAGLFVAGAFVLGLLKLVALDVGFTPHVALLLRLRHRASFL